MNESIIGTFKKRTRRILAQVIVAMVLITSLRAGNVEGALQPVDLRCVLRLNPLGMGDRTRGLSWQLESPAQGTLRGETQSAYEIRVGSGLADLWDSGKIKNTASWDIIG